MRRDLGAIKPSRVFFEFLEAIGANPVSRADLKILGEVLFELHPTIAVSNFATPGTNPKHPFKVMEARHQPPGQRMHKGPDQKN